MDCYYLIVANLPLFPNEMWNGNKFTNLDLKMAFGLTMIGILPQAHLYFWTSPASIILSNLFLKVKKFLTLAGATKIIFKLQDVNL